METESSSKPQGPAAETRPRRTNSFGVVLVVVLTGIVVAGFVIWKHKSHETAARQETAVVAVAKVTREDLFNELTVPAEFRPFVEVELHAKVSGYVDKMKVDFGDKVKSGDLLATLEVPELLDQLHNAVAMQQHAEADYTNTLVLFDRLEKVSKQYTNIVAQQDIDNARAKKEAAAAAIAAAKADVERYRTLTNYTRITAPFDGVVTRRYADPGALIQAGTSSDTQSRPLVRVSDNYRLRLDFMVSVAYVKDIKVGDSAQVKVDSLGGKIFSGAITRTTEHVDKDTRTMIVEIEVPNPSLEIVPGMYASVELKVQRRPQALAIPIAAVGGDKRPTVFVVNAGSEVEERPVTVGLETPGKYEITSGLNEGDLVMVANRSFVRPGQKVEAKLVEHGSTAN